MILNHCHVFPEGVFDRTQPRKGTIAVLKELLAHVRANKGVCFAPFESQVEGILEDPNKWLCEMLKKEEVFQGFVTVDPKRQDAADILEGYIQNGFVGAKVHSPIFKTGINHPSAEKFYTKAEQLGIPILFHTGVHGWELTQYMPILLDKVARKHPGLNIIIEHVGGVAFFDQALAVLQNNSNCHAGITSTIVRSKNILWKLSKSHFRLLLDYIGPQRIIYGTDFPWNEPEEIIEDICTIRSWELSEEDKENILGNNIERLIEQIY